MSVPMKSGGMKSLKVIILVILSGITTGIGALSAGAMLYVVTGELIPEANNLYKGRISALANILGIIIGIIATRI